MAIEQRPLEQRLGDMVATPDPTNVDVSLPATPEQGVPTMDVGEDVQVA